MAHVTSHRNHAASNISLLARLGEVIEQFRDSITLYREFQRTHAELASLSDRELNDLGLNRTMLTRVAWESVIEQAEDRKPG